MKFVFLIFALILFSGCGIVKNADRLGADLDFGIGGIISYLGEIHLKASVAIERTVPDEESHHHSDVTPNWGFL